MFKDFQHSYEPRWQPPPGHEINPRARETINGRGKKKKQNYDAEICVKFLDFSLIFCFCCETLEYFPSSLIRLVSLSLPPCYKLTAQSIPLLLNAPHFHHTNWHYSSLTDENNDSTCRRMPGIPRLFRNTPDGFTGPVAACVVPEVCATVVGRLVF